MAKAGAHGAGLVEAAGRNEGDEGARGLCLCLTGAAPPCQRRYLRVDFGELVSPACACRCFLCMHHNYCGATQVAVVPGNVFHAAGKPNPHFRVSFASAADADMSDGMVRRPWLTSGC